MNSPEELEEGRLELGVVLTWTQGGEEGQVMEIVEGSKL